MATVKAFIRTSKKKAKQVNIRFRLSDGYKKQLFYCSNITIDPDNLLHTAHSCLAMYAINSKKHDWWKEVNIIIWGAAAKLAGNDTQCRTALKF